MDNATHALVGLLVAEAAIRLAARRGDVSPGFAAAARWMSVLGNNLGDLDFLYARRLGGKLGYLLHHRGHTHTVLIGFGLGVASFALWALVARLRRRTWPRREQPFVLGLCLLGPLLHVAMDFLNNYGVHPAWPLDDRWVYGDALFIIEPWLWIVLVPPLAAAVENRGLKFALWSLLVAGLVLVWALSMIPPSVALAVTLGGVGSILVCRARGATFRFNYAVFGVVAVIAAFALGSRVARARVLGAAKVESGERLLDVVITPCPGNPVCFSVVTAQRAGDRYTARAGRVSVLPSLATAEQCRVQPTGLTLGLAAPSLPSSPAVYWEGEWRGSVSELGRLARAECRVAAWLRFARIPFWRAEGAGLLVGDLRFDRDPELDFDELEIAPGETNCPPWLPPWRPPRSDLVKDAQGD